MSEAYLFTSLLLPAGEDPLTALCRKMGLRPDRIEELHRIHPADAAPPASLPVLDWPDAPLLAHFVLQQGCVGLVSGRHELIVLTQVSGAQTCALLLGAPAAVGRFNLLPQARLEPLPAFTAGEDGLSLAATQAIGLLPQDVSFTHLAGDVLPDARLLFNASGIVAEERGALFQLHALLAAGTAWGVLVSQSAAAGLATVVERI